MIEPMKKVIFLLHNNEKKKVLAKLQQLGLIHLEIDELPSRDKVRQLEKKKQIYKTIIQKIQKLHKSKITKKASIFQVSGELIREKSELFPEGVNTFHQRMIHLETIFERLEKKYLAKEELLKNKKILEPWGNFDWDKLENLKNHEIFVEFYIATQNTFKNFKPIGEYIYKINQKRDLVYLIRIYEANSSVKPLLFEKIELPRMSLAEIENDLKILEHSIEKDEEYLNKFLNEEENIVKVILELETLLDFERAKSSLKKDPQGLLFFITGYFPKRKLNEIVKFLNLETISYAISDPKYGEDVPILLRNHWFAKPFEQITKVFSLPKYNELDPTAMFAPFFTLFFGLCLGDIGYGLILLVASILIYFRIDKNRKMIPTLLIFLSLSTVFSGILLNTFFGERFFKTDDSTFYVLETGAEVSLFSAYTLEGKTIYPVLNLSILIGFLQLSFGIFLQIINRYLYHQNFMYCLQPIFSLLILWGGMILAIHNDFLNLGFNQEYTIGLFPIGKWIAQFPETMAAILFYSGILGFFLFNNPQKKILWRPVFGVWEAYQFLIGFAGDFLSYVRLFALGLASGLLGSAFNQIAFMILPDGSFSSPLLFVTIFILILGHTLNIALSVLGAFVHPIRLTFVEFYKNMNFSGGGREFKAFTISKAV